MTSIKNKLDHSQKRIAHAAKNASRSVNEIALLAVSKTKPSSDIIEAYQAGQRLFGENYVQEAETKINELSKQYPDIEWHFIGPLQSNKTKTVAHIFNWVHTLEREKIATRLSQQRPKDQAPINVCIQVNISAEDTKSGVLQNEVITLAKHIDGLNNIQLRGLMAIPSANVGEAQARLELSQLQALFIKLKVIYPQVDTLSVGMSQDLEFAVEYGSTMVRIGSAIFGARK
ncbi:YggS family pyridoxal phosphate-dependent enzyme [Shewanella surugensis]|uniref:Pyridoxal phosphate homeostasis protein n=1 Tax=Shewanella surugensis TaxID=212020 RepID=A0ABT0LFQ8_9GAMM|nr:YggS family pyridoxal phosphate-dependent enzyme [Shewanella surugensis]MCL1126542.1 YggS family pyridoxal phosphate-dependent enzyme [Shewanella surugensis]